MATLPTQSFSTIVTNIVSGIQGRASKLINFAIGSTLRAVAEGFAGILLWFQGMLLLVLKASRLSTSSGIDVDTFTADFMPVIAGSQTAALPSGSPRLGAQAASGQASFSRFTAAPSTCFIPAATAIDPNTGVITNAGASNAATAQTSDGSQTFVVMADTTFATYSSTLGGYTLAANTASIIVPVQAQVPGASGNVQAGAISVMTTPIAGIDTVSNAAAFTNGANQESDGALKTRFQDYILGLSRGDYYGLQSSINGTGVTVQWSLTELYNYDGSYHPGYFFVIADDGSGSPSKSFLATVTTAAQAVRPLGIQCAVFSSVILTANVGMQITTIAGYDHNTVVAQVADLVATSIDSLGLGNPLSTNQLAAWAYTVPGVKAGNGVSSVTINGVSGDVATILPTKKTQDGQNTIAYATIKAGQVNIS